MKRKMKSQLDPVIPNALGMQLSEAQINEISQTLYSRFYQQYGKPDWMSPFNDQTRHATMTIVKQVVDSMTLLDYQFLKG